MSLPLWSVFFLISIPCSEKNPFLIPRSSGSAFAIGSVFDRDRHRLPAACAGALAAVRTEGHHDRQQPGDRESRGASHPRCRPLVSSVIPFLLVTSP